MLPLPGELRFEDWSEAPVVSPDGRVVAFSADPRRYPASWIRPLESRALTMLQGTEGAARSVLVGRQPLDWILCGGEAQTGGGGRRSRGDDL